MARTQVHMILLGIVFAMNLCCCTKGCDPQYCSLPYEGPPCDSQARYRTMDGTCNNLANPTWGAAMTPKPRLLMPMYTGGLEAPRQFGADGKELPSPRSVSNYLSITSTGKDALRQIGADGQLSSSPHNISNSVFSVSDDGPINDTQMLMQWGQFLDHDIDLAPISVTFDCCNEAEMNNSECCQIDIPENDPQFSATGQTCRNVQRSERAPNDDCPFPIRQQINSVTSYMDASFLYGSSDEEMIELRAEHGLLKSNPHRQLPKDHRPDECILLHPDTIWCPLAGYATVGMIPSLMASDTVFVREHNRIATTLRYMNDNWDDETVFQETRRIIVAIVQHISYNEYLPAILDDATMTKYNLRSSVEPKCNSVYNPEVNAGIANSFSTAIFRKFADRIRNRLFPDLPALTINRGRDHGLPSYNYYRHYCDLDYARDFDMDCIPDHTSESTNLLKSVYRSVWDIDVYTGAITEVLLENSSVGPLTACLLGEQFSKSKVGDRFWYETNAYKMKFTPRQLKEIKKVTLASVLCLNYAIDTIQPNVFLTSDNGDNPLMDCNKIHEIDLSQWKAYQQGGSEDSNDTGDMN